jgi:hypothetical protein
MTEGGSAPSTEQRFEFQCSAGLMRIAPFSVRRCLSTLQWTIEVTMELLEPSEQDQPGVGGCKGCLETFSPPAYCFHVPPEPQCESADLPWHTSSSSLLTTSLIFPRHFHVQYELCSPKRPAISGFPYHTRYCTYTLHKMPIRWLCGHNSICTVVSQYAQSQTIHQSY